MSADQVVRARRAMIGNAERAVAMVVSGGRISALQPYDAPVDALLDRTLGADEVLLPGLVDTHVHVNEPGRTHWEGYRSATRAAAAGGVTTVIDMPLNSLPPTLSCAALHTKRTAAEDRCWVDVGFWGGVTDDSIDDLPGLLDAGVFGVKGFLCESGVDEFAPIGGTALLRAAETVACVARLLLVHAEAPITTGPRPSTRSYAQFLASRPAGLEATAVAQIIEVAERTGCRVHVVHVSSAEAVELIGSAQSRGVEVSGETCPHYLIFDADRIGDGRTEFKCCPPIRGSDHQDALWDALRAGTLSAVVSDHSPSPPDLKLTESGDFTAAWGGIASLQIGLSAMWTAARRRDVPLAELVTWMSAGPARVADVRNKGTLAVGNDADWCVFAPDDRFVIAGAALEHRHPLTPYEGLTVIGRVRETWLRGERIDLSDVPRGQLLTSGAT